MVNKTSNTINQFPVYKDIEDWKMKILSDTFLTKIKKIAMEIFTEEEIINISRDEETLNEIITRIEKRRLYFHIYYNGLALGEINEASLSCFWIIKLMPFKHPEIENSKLNVKIGFAFLIASLSFIAKENQSQLKLNKILELNLMYALEYRDLSKEAIMAIAESLIC